MKLIKFDSFPQSNEKFPIVYTSVDIYAVLPISIIHITVQEYIEALSASKVFIYFFFLIIVLYLISAEKEIN